MKTNAARVLDRLGIPYLLRTYRVDPQDVSAVRVAERVRLPAGQDDGSGDAGDGGGDRGGTKRDPLAAKTHRPRARGAPVSRSRARTHGLSLRIRIPRRRAAADLRALRRLAPEVGQGARARDSLRRARTGAEEAWQSKNEPRCVVLLGPFTEHLTPTEIKKLEYARRQSRRAADLPAPD
jgi:hypothetical protein